jgi:hypothetical protein
MCGNSPPGITPTEIDQPDIAEEKHFHSGETRFRIAASLRANDKNNSIST